MRCRLIPLVAERLRLSGSTRVERLNASHLWFTEGVRRRQVARRDRRCVECGVGLASRRTPYCSRQCRWKFHGHFFWDAARRVALRRDRYRCRTCGVRRLARFLDVDHIVELAAGGEPFALENLQTLCRPCHRRKTVGFLRTRAAVRGSFRELDRTGDERVDPDWFPA